MACVLIHQNRLLFLFILSDPLQQEMAMISHNGEIDGLVQDCSNSIANALELLQSCTKPWKW